MALNFSVSYTFSPNTTISSSQVNTNTSDVAAVFQGLEAETKTLAKLKVDIDPTLALEVATKQYVDHYSTYRRPVLQYSSGTVVNMETGINGSSGVAQILFPDGNLRTDSTSGRINCNLAQVAALSGTAQSGIQTGTVAANTWYAIYAVKTSDNSSNFVAVADTNLPIRASFSTLNSNFGASSWVYLGLIRYGDNCGTTTGILKFTQAGNMTLFKNAIAFGSTSGGIASRGTRLANTAGATSLAYNASTGVGTTNVPNNVTFALYDVDDTASATSSWLIGNNGNAYTAYKCSLSNGVTGKAEIWLEAQEGITSTFASSDAGDIFLAGFVDGVLGVGSNPLL